MDRTQQLIPRELTQLNPFAGSLTGEELLPIYNPITGKTLRLKTSEIRGGEDKTQRWLSTETYATGDIRAWNLKFWKSLVDGNLNNQPVEGAYWTEVSKSESGNLGYWAAGVFTVDPTIVMFSDKLYWLDNTVVTIPFESIDFAAELAANKWKLITGSVGGVTTHSELTGKDDEAGFQHVTSTEKTNLTDHINGADEQKHTSNQITNTAALPNIGTDANEKLSVILGEIDGKISGGGGGHIIQEEGAYLPQRSNLNFIGAAVNATDNAATDSTDVTIDASAKASSFTQNNLKKFNATGDDEDSGILAQVVDVYEPSTAVKNELNTESNWFDGSNNPKPFYTATGGTRGQRWKGTNWIFECYEDLNWIRTPINNGYREMYGLSLATKALLENTTNWTGTAYTGTAITDAYQGQKHYDSTYVFEFVENFVPVRYLRS